LEDQNASFSKLMAHQSCLSHFSFWSHLFQPHYFIRIRNCSLIRTKLPKKVWRLDWKKYKILHNPSTVKMWEDEQWRQCTIKIPYHLDYRLVRWPALHCKPTLFWYKKYQKKAKTQEPWVWLQNQTQKPWIWVWLQRQAQEHWVWL
jgi:hypothetical protein